MTKLQLLTYLAPGIPIEFFELLRRRIQDSLGVETLLASETRTSGPFFGREADPFLSGEVDVAIMCAPSYLWLKEKNDFEVELVSAAPQYVGTRGPVYFSEVVVRAENPARDFSDLKGARWLYNERRSMSGYFNVLKKLAATGRDQSFFSDWRSSGSHRESMRRIAEGKADAAAIDSNVLRLEARRDGSVVGRLRVVERWGPYPIQPLVVRGDVEDGVKKSLASCLLSMHRSDDCARDLLRFDVERFVEVSEADYQEEWGLLRGCAGLDLECGEAEPLFSSEAL